jgi:O-antigen ligase
MQNNWHLFWPPEMPFFLAAALSATYSFFSNSAPGILYHLWCMFLMPPLLYFTIIQIGHAESSTKLERTIKWWGPFISLQLFVSVLFFIASGNTGDLHFNANTFWAKQNYIAALLVLLTIYIYGSLIQNKFKDRKLALCLSLTVLGIFATLSRGGLLSLFVGIAIFHWFNKDIRLKLLLYVIPATLIVILIVARIDNRFTSLVDMSNLSRLYLWLQAIEQFLYKPIFGGGVSKVWLYATFLSKDTLFTGPHNFVLKLLMDEGLAGTIPYLIMIGIVIYNAHKLYRLEKDPTLLTLFVTALFNSLFEPTFQGYHYSFIFWFFAALTSLKLKHAIAARTTALISTPAPQ